MARGNVAVGMLAPIFHSLPLTFFHLATHILFVELIFMGTGTSMGVPAIASEPEGLDLTNPHNWRTRASVHVVMGGKHFQVDAGPEFRMQCLACNIREVDYFLLTHAHADHIMGMDDLRRFCAMRTEEQGPLPVYSYPQHLDRVRTVFHYAIREKPEFKYYPTFGPTDMPECLKLEGVGKIWSTPMPHGKTIVMGLIFEEAATGQRLGYFTDCHAMPEAARNLCQDLDVLIIDALRERSHPSHLNIEGALEIIDAIKPKQTYFIHMNYEVDEATIQPKLPDGVALAWDGLRVDLG